MSDSLCLLDCSPPDSSVHGVFHAGILGCHFLLQGIFPIQWSNPGLPSFRQTLLYVPPEVRLKKKKEKKLFFLKSKSNAI